MCEEIESDLKKLIVTEENEHNISVFRRLYSQFRREPSKIDWSRMRLLDEDHYSDYEALARQFDAELGADNTNGVVGALLSRLVVVKLNGGLGTTMHCAGPKSLIELRDGLTFLDFVLIQNQKLNERHGTKVPLLLMNSFNTDVATVEALNQRPAELCSGVQTFLQARCPRIYADTLRPVPSAPNDRLEDGWYPPGHGNVFESLAHSGLLDRLLAEGRDIAFISNIDNTGADVDLPIAAAMARGAADYLMEVTPRTATDVKGGAVIKYEGRFMHLEMPQVPDDRVDEFCSLRTFKIFNTNNIWVNLCAVREKLAGLTMEILANHKRLSTAHDNRTVIQLETSVGGAIRNFERALCLRVARHRFLPVKSTQEMLPLQSNAYCVDHADGVLKLAREGASRPLVVLSAEFAPVDAFRRRVATPLNLADAESFTVRGDVTFGRNVTIVGNVKIIAKPGESLFIEDNTVIRG